MKRFQKVVLAAMASGAVALGAVPASAAVSGDGNAAQEKKAASEWTVRVENRTPMGPDEAGSQPLSPPVVIVHSADVNIWKAGQVASHGVAAVAEDGNADVLVDAVKRLPGVRSATVVTDAPIPSGQAVDATITLRPGDRISVASMLVNTNDGFTGVHSLRPRADWFEKQTRAYDAGSEQNTEAMSDIPGPCCGNPMVRVPEGNVIRPHEGITGRGDLDVSAYGWDGPVANLEFERVG